MVDEDFLITNIKNNEHNVLVSVLMCVINKNVYHGRELSEKKEFSKEQIIFFIENGFSVKTAYEISEKEWDKGSQVNVVKFKDGKYLRTDNNNIEEDNLDNLPNY